jgi:hypothetical protein
VAAWKRSKGDGDPPAKPEEPKADRCWCDDVTVEALAVLLLSSTFAVFDASFQVIQTGENDGLPPMLFVSPDSNSERSPTCFNFPRRLPPWAA